VLAKHYWEGRDFNKPTLDPPLTSGPYRLTDVKAGKSYKLERVPDYWAKDAPVNKGRYNFDVIQHDYYRDISIEFESFMAGNTDMRWETLPHQWATGYDVPAVKDGRLIKEEFEYSGSTLYAGFYFNLRNPKFHDRRVREAISNAFDFEWVNKTILYNLFVRLRSHFDNTELANDGVPEALELEILEPFRNQLDPRVFAEPWEPPKTDATEASARENLRKAAMLLRDAGYSLNDGKMVTADGQALSIELLLWDPFWERVTAPFVANLKRLGIDAKMRLVERAEWFQRMESFEYEMTQGFTLPQPLSPGSEQREYWGSAAADQRGSNNWMGIKDPVVDALIEKLIHAPDRATQVAATRALDRVLCWGFYSIPYGYTPRLMTAYWNRFGRPDEEPTWLRLIWYSSTWWVDPDKEAALVNAGGKKAK
jgi:microcin C transport system substrate-binding protein